MSSQKYRVDSGVEMPAEDDLSVSIYPFAMMDVGDSFLVPLELRTHLDTLSQAALRTRLSVNLHAQEFANKQFTSRVVSDGLRVWRTA